MRTSIKGRIERLEQRGAIRKLDMLAYEFASRTDQDLEHFATHGFWPGPRGYKPTAEQVAVVRKSLGTSHFAGRTDQELDHFAKHGVWPDATDRLACPEDFEGSVTCQSR